jgi:hypothetical protein
MLEDEDLPLFDYDPLYVQIKARWISEAYELPYDRVLKILERTVIKEPIFPFEYGPDECDEIDNFVLAYYLNFHPDLEDGLRFLRPEVALALFESESDDEIKRWMEVALPKMTNYFVYGNYWGDTLKYRLSFIDNIKIDFPY